MVYFAPQLDAARVRMATGDRYSFPVHDITALSRLLFDEGSGTRALRTLTRALIKYAATQAAKEQSEGLGSLLDLVTSVNERADTRSWSLLPDQIHMLRIRLPEGTHDLDVEIVDAGGVVGEVAAFEGVRVLPGRITILHHRSFR